MVGFAAGVALSATVMDRLVMRLSEKKKKKKKKGGAGHKPENRLVPIVWASPLIPAGLLLYGWSLQAGLHFVVPIVGSALVGAGMVLTLVCYFLLFFFFFCFYCPFFRYLKADRVCASVSCLSTPTSWMPSRPSPRLPSQRRRCCVMCSGLSCRSLAPRSMTALGWAWRTRCWPVYPVFLSLLLCCSSSTVRD